MTVDARGYSCPMPVVMVQEAVKADAPATLEVLVEGYEDGQYFGRSYMEAPEIDTKVYFTSEEELTPGSYVPVLITDACEYDLIGTVPHKEETT